jgi:hypothetical protein
MYLIIRLLPTILSFCLSSSVIMADESLHDLLRSVNRLCVLAVRICRELEVFSFTGGQKLRNPFDCGIFELKMPRFSALILQSNGILLS